MRPIDRRAFLGLSAGALAWACSRPAEEEEAGDFSLVATGLEGLAVGDSRNAIAVFKGDKPYRPRELEARLVSATGRARPLELSRQRITFGRGGDFDTVMSPESVETTDIYVFRQRFDAGIWRIEASIEGERAEAVFQVGEDSPSPVVGQEALASQSPTTSDARGVDPICTRTPRCSMHGYTIAEALDRSKPLVVNFGTPALCTSRTCGPVVDLIEQEKERVGEDVSFVHVEVYKNSNVAQASQATSPVFSDWKLTTEPWTYFVDADGVIRDRWLGVLGRGELARTVDSLIA